jgi:hypothetical protein
LIVRIILHIILKDEKMDQRLNDLVVNALVTAAKEDLRNGTKKDELLFSLSKVLNGDIYHRVRDRL